MKLALYMFATLLIAFPGAAVAALTRINEHYLSESATLLQLRDSLNYTANLRNNWTGPPCIRNQNKWDGIDCWNGHVNRNKIQLFLQTFPKILLSCLNSASGKTSSLVPCKILPIART